MRVQLVCLNFVARRARRYVNGRPDGARFEILPTLNGSPQALALIEDVRLGALGDKDARVSPPLDAA